MTILCAAHQFHSRSFQKLLITKPHTPPQSIMGTSRRPHEWHEHVIVILVHFDSIVDVEEQVAISLAVARHRFKAGESAHVRIIVVKPAL